LDLAGGAYISAPDVLAELRGLLLRVQRTSKGRGDPGEKDRGGKGRT